MGRGGEWAEKKLQRQRVQDIVPGTKSFSVIRIKAGRD